MKELKQYIIPISGLKEGLHEFDFQIDSVFFACFEKSPIEEGKLNVKFYFDKQVGMYVLTFAIDGHVKVECDRCLEMFNLPIQTSQSLIAKFKEGDANDADIIHIDKDAPEVNIATFIYEFIVLSVPPVTKHEDADEECPEDVFDYLNKEEEDETPSNNPFLDALKDFKSN